MKYFEEMVDYIGKLQKGHGDILSHSRSHAGFVAKADEKALLQNRNKTARNRHERRNGVREGAARIARRRRRRHKEHFSQAA